MNYWLPIMKCYLHNDVEAIYNCAVCGRPICSSCETFVNGKSLCEECVMKATGGSETGKAEAPVPAAPVGQPVPPSLPAAQPSASGAPAAASAIPESPATPTALATPAAPIAPAAPGAVNAKEPILSALLSFFVLGGLGQIYNGQVKKGLCFIAIEFLCFIVIVAVTMPISVLTFGLGVFCCFPFFFLPLVWRVYSVYDAYTVAEQINRGEIVTDWFT